MAVCFTVITLIVFLKHKHSTNLTSVLALSFLLLGVGLPSSLKYVYIAWMRLAFILGWVNTRLLLCLIFYIIFSLVGLLMRLLRIDLLERKLNRSCDSYWKLKEAKKFAPADYERQF